LFVAAIIRRANHWSERGAGVYNPVWHAWCVESHHSLPELPAVRTDRRQFPYQSVPARHSATVHRRADDVWVSCTTSTRC